jgi:FkbM family methyltransferase
VIYRRINQFCSETGVGHSPRDWLSFAVLGIARSRLPAPILSFVQSVFSEIVLCPELLAGLQLAIDPWDRSHMAIFYEIFRDNAYDLKLVPFTPDQIFDCGGHIGMFSLLARSRYRKIPLVVFEPNPHNVKWINRQLRLNSIDIEVVQAAVSTRSGEAIFQDRLSYGGHLLEDSTPRASEAVRWYPANLAEQTRGPPKGCYTVRLVDLPAMISHRRPRQLLLKLDIEGEEVHIIPSLFANLPRETAVFFETHHGEGEWSWAKGLFEDHGFSVERRRCIYDVTDGFALRR